MHAPDSASITGAKRSANPRFAPFQDSKTVPGKDTQFGKRVWPATHRRERLISAAPDENTENQATEPDGDEHAPCILVNVFVSHLGGSAARFNRLLLPLPGGLLQIAGFVLCF